MAEETTKVQKQVQLLLRGARLSFPDLWEPKEAQGGGEARYSASFILEKVEDKEQLLQIKDAITKLAVDNFGGAEKVKELREKNKLRFCLHYGDEKTYDGYNKGNMFISTSSKVRPLVVDRDRSPLTKEDSRPYAGCYVDAVVSFWVQDNNFGKAINAELKGVQFVKDGEPFGSGPARQEDFIDHTAGEKKPDEKAAADDDEIRI